MFKMNCVTLEEYTFMFPSAEPVTKTSSEESMASALMAESCAWNVWSSCLWRMSKIQTNPFRPPVMISCCLGAYWRTVAPFSWHWNAGYRKNTRIQPFYYIWKKWYCINNIENKMKSYIQNIKKLIPSRACGLTVYHWVTWRDQRVP